MHKEQTLNNRDTQTTFNFLLGPLSSDRPTKENNTNGVMSKMKVSTYTLMNYQDKIERNKICHKRKY